MKGILFESLSRSSASLGKIHFLPLHRLGWLDHLEGCKRVHKFKSQRMMALLSLFFSIELLQEKPALSVTFSFSVYTVLS
jgi:hypothetical protein